MTKNTPSSTFSQRWAQIILALTNAYHETEAPLRKAAKKISHRIGVFCYGESAESPKVVVHSRPGKIIWHCGVHFFPVSAVIIFSYLNWTGHFIGTSLRGWSDDTSQAIARLSLQVTAKLIELLVIASMSVIVMDIVRRKLLLGDEGLPLGLITAKFCFGDIRYIASQEFRASCRGFKRQRTRWGLGLVISVCAVIAVLVGPSTALLLIPTWYTAWPAGGATFWIIGDLSPTTLERLDWPPQCETIQEQSEITSLKDPTLASCNWAGFPYIADAFQQRIHRYSEKLTYNDGHFARSIRFYARPPRHAARDNWPDSVRAAAIASNLAIGSYSNYLGQSAWCSALSNSELTEPGKKYGSLKFRRANGTRGYVRGRIPVVRTQCFDSKYYMNPDVNVTKSEGEPPERTTILPFPIIPETIGSRDQRYFIPVQLPNTSDISAHWIPIPTGKSNTSYGHMIDQYPSAFLVIQNADLYGLPGLDQNSTLTCSVQADWAPGTHVASEFCWGELRSIKHEGVLDDIIPLENWAFKSGEKSVKPVFQKPTGWEQVNITLDWLNALTPPLKANATGFTTLASITKSTLTRIPRNDTSKFTTLTFEKTKPDSDNIVDIFTSLSLSIAASVADGMSRVGYSEAYVTQLNDENTDVGNWFQTSWENVRQDLLLNRARLVPEFSPLANMLGKKYTFSVTIEGHGLMAAGTAHYLAFTVVYVYIILVIGHLVYTIKNRHIGNSWSTITDLLVLSLNSPPPQDQGALRDTSAGISTHKVLRHKMRIRQCENAPAGSEMLQLLLGADGMRADSKKVKPNKEYGAV